MKQKTNWTRGRAQVTVAGALALMVWCGASHAGQRFPATVPSPFREASFERDWQRTARVVDVKGGVLILPGTLHRQRLAAFRDEQSFTDVRLTAEFLVHRRGAPGHSFGIAFGSTDSQTYHALQVERQKVSLVRVAGGKTAAVLASKAIKNDEGKTRRVHLTQREGHVEVFYQSEPGGKWAQMFEQRLPAPPAGWVGVYAEGAKVHVTGFLFSGRRVKMKQDWKLIKD